MKKVYRYRAGDKTVERQYTYIPVRYILAILITVLEVAAVIGLMVLICLYVPYFYILCYVTAFGCILTIVASDDNPEYKVPWLLFVLTVPIVGFMLYFMFYSRKLRGKFIRRQAELSRYGYETDEGEARAMLDASPVAGAQAQMLTRLSHSHLFSGTEVTYFPSGEAMWESLLPDLARAEHFIFMEYFIIEEGKFWDSILAILKEKAQSGVTVRVVYDDIGCMTTLPGDYARTLRSFGIEAVTFSRLRGAADSEFNNRSHRKITVIDGRVGYTGGVNIADEYINEKERFGHWKDTGVRLAGAAVYELTRLFLSDYGMNVRSLPEDALSLYPTPERYATEGVVIPFGDGPRPLYERRVAKGVIQNMLNAATRYAYMTTPYLILDSETLAAIEGAALRGVDVRVIVPHVPDKRLVFEMTQSFYPRLLSAGVRIYEYTPGFIHAKSYLVDGEYAMIGTVNLDYRSLVHHFENGVWLYRSPAIAALSADLTDTLAKSEEITAQHLRVGPLRRLLRAVIRIFAPML